jgi:tetratricopeptide (TPR) repeat protein
MRKMWRWFSRMVLAGALMAPVVAAQAGVEEGELARAIGQLGNASFEVREKATRWLWSMGKAAESALLEASKSRDPEVAARAREVLGDFRCGIRPQTPEEIIELIRRYRHGQADTKQRVMATMMRMGQRAYPFLVRLWSVEPDPAQRSRIYQELLRHLSQTVCAFVAEGDLATTEELLEAGAAEGTEPATRYWAVYCVLRGNAPEKIQQLRKRLERDSAPQVARSLMYLYRAGGDWVGARWAAEKMGETDLLKDVQFEMGDWKALAGSLRRVAGDGPDLRTLTLLTTLDRLAGSPEDLEHDLTLIPQHAENSPEQASEAARAFLMNDRVEEAVALYVKHQRAVEHLEILWTQQRYKEAMELAAAKLKEGGGTIVLQCDVARRLHYLGESRQAAKMLDDLAAKLTASGEWDSLGVVATFEMRIGLEEQAIEHGAKAMAKAGPERSAWLLNGLFMERAASAAAWRGFLRAGHVGEDEARILKRVYAVVEGRLPLDEAKALAEEAMRATARMNRLEGNDLLAAVGETMLDRGQEPMAQAAYEQLVAQSDEPEHVMALAGLMLRREQWLRAAELYGLAMEKDRGSAAARYLRGWALVKVGQEKEGRDLMALGTLLPLGSEDQRQQLIAALKEVGLEAQAAEQNELLRRTAAFGSEGCQVAIWSAALEAQNQKDFARAALLWQVWLLEGPRRGWMMEPGTYLTRSYLVHKLRAAGWLKEGKVEEALQEMAICQKLMPGEIELVIDLARPLEKLGRKKEAEALFAQTAARAGQVCQDYPGSAMSHNNLAWLLARCGKDLDGALEHAQKGVELDPRNTAIIDTLAEVHFQRGEKAKAVEAMRWCMELEPRNWRHKLALKRIEGGLVESDPPPG